MIFSFNLYYLLFIYYFFILYNYAFNIIILICILAELNRVPFDLPESESELVAGFITEYSSIYFSLIILTEYANTIALILLVIIIFNLPFSFIIFLLSLFSIIRSTLNRLKFDELMTNCWIVILPFIFTYCLLLLFIIHHSLLFILYLPFIFRWSLYYCLYLILLSLSYVFILLSYIFSVCLYLIVFIVYLYRMSLSYCLYRMSLSYVFIVFEKVSCVYYYDLYIYIIVL
jgi:hypothetical protein